MKSFINEDRLSMKAIALQVFMSLSATVGSTGALYFVLAILSWFNWLRAGFAYPIMFIGMPILAVGGMRLSACLGNWYIGLQAQMPSCEVGEFYEMTTSAGTFAQSPTCLLLASVMLGLLTTMAGYENLLAFWSTGALLTVIFIIGCVVMAKVFQACRRMETELIKALPPQEWTRPVFQNNSNSARRTR